MNKKVLIIGGGGFIGSNLVKYFLQMNYNVSVYDRDGVQCQYENVKVLNGDAYCDFGLEKIVTAFDIVINAVSMISPATNLENLGDTFSEDINLNIRLMRALINFDVRYIFLSSAGAIYGNSKAIDYNEDACTRPINFYGSSKLCIESICHVMNNLAKKSKFIVARIANAFGPGQNYKRGVGFIDAVVKCAISGETLSIYGNGKTVRDYIYIDDICYLVECIARYSGAEEIFNISTGVGYTQNDIISFVEKYGFTINKQYIDYRIGDIKTAIINNKKVVELFNFVPQNMENSLKKFIDYAKAR